jgi:hypothetical protein
METDAPAKAHMGVVEIPAMVRATPNLIESAAPKAAPDATPSVKGVAREFLKSAWKAIPAAANPAPASQAAITLGILILQKISPSTPEAAGSKIACIGVIFMPIRGMNRRTRALPNRRKARTHFGLTPVMAVALPAGSSSSLSRGV